MVQEEGQAEGGVGGQVSGCGGGEEVGGILKNQDPLGSPVLEKIRMSHCSVSAEKQGRLPPYREQVNFRISWVGLAMVTSTAEGFLSNWHPMQLTVS